MILVSFIMIVPRHTQNELGLICIIRCKGAISQIKLIFRLFRNKFHGFSQKFFGSKT